MAKVLTTGDAYDGAVAWLLSDGSGRNMQVRVADSSTFAAPTWASVLASGNSSGGTDVVISGTDELQFAITPGTALIRIADGLRFVANGTDALFLNDATLRIESSVELELDTNPGPAVIRGTDALAFFDAATQVLELTNSDVNVNVNTVQWESTVASPILTQATQTAGAGRQLTVRSQAGQAGVGVGGNLLLTSGTGTTSGNVLLRPNSGSGSNGSVIIQQATGPTAVITASPTGLAFWNGTAANRPSITGSRGGNAALASLLTALDSMGLITNNTTA